MDHGILFFVQWQGERSFCRGGDDGAVGRNAQGFQQPQIVGDGVLRFVVEQERVGE